MSFTHPLDKVAAPTLVVSLIPTLLLVVVLVLVPVLVLVVKVNVATVALPSCASLPPAFLVLVLLAAGDTMPLLICSPTTTTTGRGKEKEAETSKQSEKTERRTN